MKPPYRTYSFEDFARDEYFRRWVIDNDSESTLFWEEWLAQHPDCTETVHLAKAFVLALKEKITPLDALELEQLTEAVLAEPTRREVPFLQSTVFRMAASILLVMSLGFGIYTYFNTLKTTFDIAAKDQYIENM